MSKYKLVQNAVPKEAMDVLRGGRTYYPFVTMKVGDALVVEAEDFTKAASAAHSFGQRNNWKFRTRRHMGDLENAILRVE